MTLHGTLLFHLNLSYSAIEVDQRGDVVRRCYEPMLRLLDRLPWLTMAVEATGHTIERMADLHPDWLDALGEHVASGRVELVGSGDTQLIGPLVPAEVNRWNQEIGLATYERWLGTRPRTALVNEMAWSQGVVDAYAEAGYELLLMEWNNPRRAHPEWDDEARYRLAWTESPTGRRIAVAWVDAIAFQKFQRAVTGELAAEAYRAWVRGKEAGRPRHLFVYANDAEVFDFRPGRFRTEPPLDGQDGVEWRRVEALVRSLRDDGVELTTPGRLAEIPGLAPTETLRLSSGADPVPVKKQPKYNVTRWALSGRDDVGLNARCHAQAARLREWGGDVDDWRELCRLWASDLRTHLTDKRWAALLQRLPDPARPPEPDPGPPLARSEVERVEDGRILRVTTDGVVLRLSPRRGLAIEALAFPPVAAEPLVGTLPHGYFDHIDWAADFYSGNSSILRPGLPLVTDLEACEPVVERFEDRVEVRAVVPTHMGGLPKTWVVRADRVELRYGFSALGERPPCSLRTGTITLLPEAFGEEVSLTCCNGGAPETFRLEDCDHGRSVSALVSAGAAFGATTGELTIGDGRVALDVAWPVGAAPALPMSTVKRIEGRRFLRCAFSLAELDETYRAGARLHDFRLTLAARRVA